MYLKRTRKGWSLLELLVASSVSVIVVLGFLNVTTDFFRRDSVQRQQVLSQQRLRLAAAVLAADIQQAGYIYPNPATAANLLTASSATVKLPTGSTAVLALLIPYQLNGVPDSNSRFQLVIYASGPKPNIAPYNAVASIQGTVLYRWYSQPEYFDPRTQKMGQNGTGNPPGSLGGNFLVYGGPTGETIAPLLVGNLDTITMTSAAATFPTTSSTDFPLPSATGESLSIRGYLATADRDGLRPAPRIDTFLQARNLGLPPNPLPGYNGVTNGGIPGNCSASGTCY